MEEIDNEIRKLLKEFQVPESYRERVDEILESIRENDIPPPRSGISRRMGSPGQIC